MCYEDEACWDSTTMGNRVIGDEAGHLTYHSEDGTPVCILQQVRGEWLGTPVVPERDCGTWLTVREVQTETVPFLLPDTSTRAEPGGLPLDGLALVLVLTLTHMYARARARAHTRARTHARARA